MMSFSSRAMSSSYLRTRRFSETEKEAVRADMNGVRQAVGALLALIFLTPAVGLSQTQSTSGATQIGDTSTQSPDTSTGFGQQQPNPAATYGGFSINALNSANPLGEDSGPLKWGWLSVRSASFLQYYGSLNFSDPKIQPHNQITRSSQFAAAMVLDHAFKASHFSVQYTPSLFVTNGNVYSNTANQTAGLDLAFPMNPRWTFQVTDRFSYYGSQRYFSDISISTNYLTGTSVQQNFLNGPGSVMVNSVGVPVTYLWSPRTTISFAPTFNYQYSTGAVLSDNASLKALYEGGQFTITHTLSPTRSIGVSYLGQYASFTSTSPHAGPQSTAFIEDLLLTYNQQFGASWHFNLGVGASNNIGLENTANTSNGTLVAVNAAITKSFHRTDFTVTYNRGHQFNGFITSSASDRIDVAQQIYWTRRFSTITSVAYFKTTAALPPSESAFYGAERVIFDLTRQLSFSASGYYAKQVGDGVFVASGIQRYVTVGITWSPQPKTPERF